MTIEHVSAGQTPGGRGLAAPVVLHAVREYLPLTENWIYEQIVHATGFRPVVVCDRLSDVQAFALPEVHPDGARGWARGVRLLNQLHRRLAYANWPGTYAAVLAAHHPALIHAHFGDRGVLMLGTARRYRLPLVTTFYGYDVSTLPREAKWVPRLRWLFAHGQMFLAEGPYMRARLLELGAPAGRTFVQHLGVDLARLVYRARLPHAGPTRLLMAASFREKKGLRYGLEAFARQHARRPGSVALTVIGDGPLREELHDLARRWGVWDRIRWLGYAPREVFHAEADAADLFMSPSVVAADGDTEGGAPVALLEAQALGLPVLATTHADIPEVTRPGRSAWLVPERDVDALAERLAWLVEAPETWAAMGQAGRAHVEAEFDASTQGARLTERYRSLLAA